MAVTTPVPTGNAYDILDAPDSPSSEYSSGRTSLGSRIERNLAAAVRECQQALDAEIAAINAIPSSTYCNVPDRLDALRRDMDETRDLVASLHGDLWRDLIATTTALSTLLCTVNENNARLSAEASNLSSRILQHQVHLDKLMKFEEARRAQMDNHWRAMETLTSSVKTARADSTSATTALASLIESLTVTVEMTRTESTSTTTALESLSATVATVQSETTSNATALANLAVSINENKLEAKTQHLRLSVQLDGLWATTEATTTAARTDINDIRGHLLPALRKHTDDVFASVETVTHSITDLTHRVETCEAARTPTRGHGDHSSPCPVPDAFPRDSPDLRTTRASHCSDSSWYHGAKPRHNDRMGPPAAGAASPGNIGPLNNRPPPLDTDLLLGGPITTPQSTNKDRAALLRNISRHDIGGLASPAYHGGEHGVSELTISFIHKCGYQSFSMDVADDVLPCYGSIQLLHKKVRQAWYKFRAHCNRDRPSNISWKRDSPSSPSSPTTRQKTPWPSTNASNRSQGLT